MTATAIAEHFARKGRAVLLVLDSLTRFAMAAREIGLAAGEPPTGKRLHPLRIHQAGQTGRESWKLSRRLDYGLLHRADGGG